MNRSLFICLATSLFVFAYNGTAQRNPYDEVTISSPTAAAFGKYVDMPVSEHTGIPEIQVPIYTVQLGTLTLPISLSYHAGGMKVMEPASWVGAGWTLNAGGVITRTVQGVPDEKLTNTYTSNDFGHLSDEGYNKYLFQPDGNSDLPTDEVTDFNKFNNGRKDGEPDLFFFNFAGYTGKFYFHDDGRPVLVPEGDFNITHTYNPGVGNSISSFVITTPDGTRYTFGGTAIEKSHFYDEQGFIGTNGIISSWYLTTITSADSKFVITFTYAAEEYKYFAISSFPVPGDDPTAVYEYKLYEYWVQGVRLTGINFTNGLITFEAGPNRLDLKKAAGTSSLPAIVDIVNDAAKALGAIQIHDAGNSFCKRFEFTYGYFEDLTNAPAGKFSSYALQTDRKRLKLLSVNEKSCDGTIVLPPHTFEYFTEIPPRKLSFAMDHWGYYNGQTGNTSLIPTYQEESAEHGYREFAGANRESAWPAMRAGSLKKITNPTGGSTEFEFEANTTYISFNKTTFSYLTSMSMGWDGQDPTPEERTMTFNGTYVKFYLSNHQDPGNAYFTIYNSSNVAIHFMTANPGESKNATFKLGPGNFRLTLSRQNPKTGVGANVEMYEWKPIPVSKNELVGGLRIKSITMRDGLTANNRVINYSYNINNESSGILYGRPTYVQVIRNDYLKDAGLYTTSTTSHPYCSPNGCLNCVTTNNPYIKSPNSIRPMDNTQGNHIGYNEVKVTETGNGHTVYRFYGSNVWDLVRDDVAYRYVNTTTCAASIPSFPVAPPVHDFKRGEVKYEGHFNESGVLQKETYFYPVFVENPTRTPALLVSSFVKPYSQFSWPAPHFTSFPSIPQTSLGMYGMPTFYELRTAKKTELKTQERLYSGAGGSLEMIKELYFESPWHTQVTRQVTKGSQDEVFETRYKYVSDFRLPACAAVDGTAAYNTAINNCSVQYTTQRAGCTTAYCVYWKYQQLLKCKSTARNNYVQQRKTHFTGLASCINLNKGTANAELKPLLEMQTKNINALVEESSFKNGSLLSSNYYRYDFFPVGSTDPYLSKVQKINLVSPQASFTAANSSNTAITKDAGYTDETLLKYHNGRIAELTPKSGLVLSYIWAHNNTFPVVKAEGVLHTTLLGAYTAAGGNVATIRSQAGMAGQHISTYTYHPLKGMLSETDMKLLTFSYEYDLLGRLKLVRDKNNNILKVHDYKMQALPTD
jgi:hypothetical protein